ncbi:MAG TPA: 16S rRNA (uracil(1498)-N(3))-methyltransferase [Kamptonema sp.]|nr:16S rRNA (uracil(1498)-N(3))-methyltransferase [Kamptonema sp.]
MAELQRLAIALSQLQNQQIMLTADQQHYLYRVLRLREGDRFIAMDGCGHWWLTQLDTPDTAIIQSEILVKSELPLDVTLMAALPKGNGFDEVVRQAVELGVYCIIPMVSDRTLLKPSSQKIERWRRIAAEAAEQSERQIVPTILEPVSFTVGVENCDRKYRYICVARGESRNLLNCLLENFDTPLKRKEKEGGNFSQSIVIATGPEGGWTESEVESAIASGFQPVSLGSRILRAVTAPIVALSLVVGALEN